MTSGNKLVKLIDESDDRNEYSNILDALKDINDIYEKTEYHLDRNVVLAEKADMKMQEFVTRQKVVAMSIANSFPPIRIKVRDEDGNTIKDEHGHYIYQERINPYGKKTHDLIMSPVFAWALMNRNSKANVMLMGILNFNSGNQDLERLITSGESDQGGVMKKLSSYFKKKEEKEQTVIGMDK